MKSVTVLTMNKSTKKHHAIRDLSAQFVTIMMQESTQGRGVQRAVSTFGKHRIKLLSGMLGGALHVVRLDGTVG